VTDGGAAADALLLPADVEFDLSSGDVFNDLDGSLTRFSRSRHFWSRISQNGQSCYSTL